MRELLKFVLLFLSSFAIFFVFWIIFTGSFDRWELGLGVLATSLGALALCVVDHANPARFRPTLPQLMEIALVPGDVLAGTWVLTQAAFRGLGGGPPAESLFRLLTFAPGDSGDPHAIARRTLANVYTTMTPNSVVLGINPRDRYLLFHQIQRGRVPKVAQHLGGRR